MFFLLCRRSCNIFIKYNDDRFNKMDNELETSKLLIFKAFLLISTQNKRLGIVIFLGSITCSLLMNGGFN